MNDRHNDDGMHRAYGVAGRLFRGRLAEERPEDARELAAVRPEEVVVVRGSYDHMHRVLHATGIPFLEVDSKTIAGVDWETMRLLLVNCPGQIPPEALERVAPWVRRGGYLLTTDWALRHVIEPAFPGTIRHNGKQTADCVVRVERLDVEDPLLSGFLEDGRDPLWWLEGASYPIDVVDPARVRVLLKSSEVADRWGTDPVAVTFDEGEGTVLHLISHLYLQRSDVRDARDARPAFDYISKELNLGDAVAARYAALSDRVRSSELQGSLRLARFLGDVTLRSRRCRR